MMLRVVTPFGLGKIGGLFQKDSFNVQLDQPFLGENQMVLDSVSQVFPFTPFVVVRVLNISGSGWFSNLQFYRNLGELLLPTPPDETTFLLSLKSGNFTVNRELGILAQEVLWIQPWVDRWAIEQSMPFEDVPSALATFELAKEKTAGTSGGIQASLLLNIREGKILWFTLSVMAPHGVIFEKKFV